MEALRRGLALGLVLFLALAPVLHVHGIEDETHDHLASCPVATLRGAEAGVAPVALPVLASPTPAPVLHSAAPRSPAARETPPLRGPPAPLA